MKHTILHVDGSMRREGSQSRKFARQLIDQMRSGAKRTAVTHRDLANGVPFVDQNWIGANFTDPAKRTPEQRALLTYSDALVSELRSADTLVLATPIYNFGVPAAVKAWIDMIARAKETFRYTEHGPEGLLKGKTGILVVTSGGTRAESKIDFATPYLRHVLGFIGIDDVKVIASQGGADPSDEISQVASRW